MCVQRIFSSTKHLYRRERPLTVTTVCFVPKLLGVDHERHSSDVDPERCAHDVMKFTKRRVLTNPDLAPVTSQGDDFD